MSAPPATRFRVPASHPCLAGHFPGRPLVPGVVILDHVQQAIEAVLSGPPGPLRLPQVKFLQPLLPDEDSVIEIDATAPSRWRFRVLRGDATIASGDVVAA